MPRQGHGGMLIEGRGVSAKIRKRGFSSSSSTSSRVRNYRLNKRAILVGKSRARIVNAVGGSGSSTHAPAWRTTPLRGTADSPKYSQSTKSTRPVSARRLAATVWGMDDMPSPRRSECMSELMNHQQPQQRKNKKASKREKMQPGWEFHSGSRPFPPHLSDPSHSPSVSEKMDRPGSGGHQRRTPSISQRLRSTELNAGISDSSGSVTGSKNRLKDASNALITSKELLKIINRIWAQTDQPSSSTSLVSALYTELERARLHVNQFIQEYRSEKKEINYLLKSFSEEKASWSRREQQAVEAAIESIAGELETERKNRHRVESLNKKLGKELAEMRSSFLKVVKDLETEKRGREITEQVCEELARNVDEDREELEMMRTSQRVEMRMSDGRQLVAGRSSALNKLRKQLEGFLGTKRDKRVENVPILMKSNGVCLFDEPEDSEIDDPIESKDGSGRSDLHSIELKIDMNKGQKETRSSNSVYGHISRQNGGSVSDGVEWGIEESKYRNSGEGMDRAKYLLDRSRYRYQ